MTKIKVGYGKNPTDSATDALAAALMPWRKGEEDQVQGDLRTTNSALTRKRDATAANGLLGGDPFAVAYAFNPGRRHQLKCELDGYYAHLYGLTRDELRYILDPADTMGDDYPSETFRGLKNNDLKQYGEYPTQRLLLQAYDELPPSFAARGARKATV